MATVGARRRIWGWYFFDWASQPYSTLLLTFIFAPYFTGTATRLYIDTGMAQPQAAAAAQAYWGYGLTVAGIAVALLSPVLGAIADGSGRRMVWIWGFSALYVFGAAGLWVLTPQAPPLLLALTLFILGFVAMEFATNFTNALLPDLASQAELGAISGSGFAFGYLGGLLSLIVMLLFFAEGGATGRTLIGLHPLFGLDPQARQGTRFVGPFVAAWYAVFMIPFFLWVHERRRPGHVVLSARASLASLAASVRGLGQRRSLASFLGASMLYRDALNALYGFGGVYAAGVLGWTVPQIGLFGILGAVTAALATWAGGRVDRRFGPRPVIAVSLLALVAVCGVVVGLTRGGVFGVPLTAGSRLPDVIFYVCGAVIGGAGGTVQAASRTMMVRHTTPQRAAEGFGLFALTGKATAFIAPLAISVMTGLSGSQQLGLVPLIVLFLLGLLLLVWVDPKGEVRPA